MCIDSACHPPVLACSALHNLYLIRYSQSHIVSPSLQERHPFSLLAGLLTHSSIEIAFSDFFSLSDLFLGDSSFPPWLYNSPSLATVSWIPDTGINKAELAKGESEEVRKQIWICCNLLLLCCQLSTPGCPTGLTHLVLRQTVTVQGAVVTQVCSVHPPNQQQGTKAISNVKWSSTGLSHNTALCTMSLLISLLDWKQRPALYTEPSL